MDRRSVAVICVDNDPEARLICELTERMGMVLIRSNQAHGATLDKEPNVLRRLRKAGNKRVVWTVELPGPRTERELLDRKYELTLIDHHVYGKMDRSQDESGNRRPSSLEQFLSLACVSDEELAGWGYDPKQARGIGIMDDRYVRGLKDAGYTADEIGRVLDLRNVLWGQLRTDHAANVAEAKVVWDARQLWQGYFLMASPGPLSVRGEVGMWSIREDLDEHPMIMSERGGQRFYVQNVEPKVIARLQEVLGKHKTFVFGAGRCWGIDCSAGAKVNLQFILDVLCLL